MSSITEEENTGESAGDSAAADKLAKKSRISKMNFKRFIKVLLIILAGVVLLLAVLTVISDSVSNEDIAAPAIDRAVPEVDHYQGADSVESMGNGAEMGTEDSAAVSSGDDENGAAAADRYIISVGTAKIEIDFDQMQHSVRSAEDIVDNYDGHVESREERYSEYEGDTVTTRIEFRIPVENYSDAVEEISAIGELESLNENSNDVTDTVLELDTRIENAEASLERLREFIADADTTEDLLNVEEQLNQRQADLEVMLSQRDNLADRAEMATLTVLFEAEVDRESAAEEPVEASEFNPNAFNDNLVRGWSGIVIAVNAILAGLGILLPWTPLLLIIGGLAWFAFRKNKKKS